MLGRRLKNFSERRNIMIKRMKLKASIIRIVYAGCVRYAIKIGQTHPQSYRSVSNLARQLKKKEPSYQKNEIIFEGLTPAQEAEFWFLYKN